MMDLDSLITIALIVSGAFTLPLGIVYIFMPLLFDFRRAILTTGEPLTPLRLGPVRYATRRSDVHGIAWVMNHAASYVLVSIGLADLLYWRWPRGATGVILALSIAGRWVLRALTQLYRHTSP